MAIAIIVPIALIIGGVILGITAIWCFFFAISESDKKEYIFYGIVSAVGSVLLIWGGITGFPKFNFSQASRPPQPVVSQETRYSSQQTIGVVQTQRDPLNIRSEPGRQYQKIGRANRGEKLIILERSGVWYKVRSQKNIVGYVDSQYIKIISSQ